MFCVLHCGGMKFNGQTIKESSLGGSETAAYYVAKELAAAGHRVTIFTNSEEGGVFDGVKYEWAGVISEAAPLGDRFTFYAENTPHDINIIQRHSRAYERKWASKVNFWWLHDLALVRGKAQASEHLWNIDKILCVSQWHKEQVCKVWGIEKDAVVVMNNGVDLALFTGELETFTIDDNKYQADAGGVTERKNLLYSSRPERGLLNLLRKDGIMEKLQTEMPEAHLYICAYENNTAHMAELYDYLYARAEELQNVTNLGALTKKQLADVMRQCDALVYPTDFEEVSCITAMEAMAAGLPFISSAVAALPETCKNSGSTLIPLREDGSVDNDTFIRALKSLPEGFADERFMQLSAALKYTWNRAASTIEDTAHAIFKEHHSERALAFHFMRHSDIPALEHCNLASAQGALSDELRMEFDKGYAFYRDDTYAQHYADYYQYEKDRGVNYGPEDCTNTSRYQLIANLVGNLPDGSRVLDYGCAHGHYTVNLAKRFPGISFVGADLAQSNVDTAVKWAADEGLANVRFTSVAGVASLLSELMVKNYVQQFDLVIAAEVVEHVGDPQHLIDSLAKLLAPTGKMVITTPYGPWEAQGYREHGYWRAHLHHFERADLHEMLGNHPDFKIVAAPAGQSKFLTALGSYITTFSKPTEPSRAIDYKRKLAETMPDQTVSLCIIVKDGAVQLPRCLENALPYVHEVIIGIDPATTDDTQAVIQRIVEKNPLVAFNVFALEQPAKASGFAAARNATIAKASCDWVFWLDADEEMVNGEHLARYTRNNQYNAYAVRQHHFSQTPLGVVKTDLPCRLFRNGKGIKFFGTVHEHPEITMNEGLGAVAMLPCVSIIHYGYTDERTRRNRFARNITLLERDRTESPDRLLGKFLMLRDYAQMCQYDVEDRRVNMGVFDYRVERGLQLWEELLASGNTRLILDAVQFYSVLVEIKGGGFDFGFTVDASKLNGGAHPEKQTPVTGKFLKREHVDRLMKLIIDDKTMDYDSKYF